jgi:hypothetical protein
VLDGRDPGLYSGIQSLATVRVSCDTAPAARGLGHRDANLLEGQLGRVGIVEVGCDATGRAELYPVRPSAQQPANDRAHRIDAVGLVGRASRILPEATAALAPLSRHIAVGVSAGL